METIEHNGQEFALGCFERSAPAGSVRPCLGEAVPLLPQALWQPLDFSLMVPDPGSQGSHGACVGFQCTSAIMSARQIAGLKPTKLSPWNLYAQICGGRDAGASIHDALKAH